MVGAKVEEVKVRQTVGAKGRYRAEVKERYLVEAVVVNPSFATHSEVHFFLTHSHLSFQTWLTMQRHQQTYLLDLTANSCPSL